MKQAILITAYKDLSFVTQIISYFDNDFVFFIHVDKKCKEDTSIFSKYPNVYLYKKYRVGWGGSNHLMAILLLMKEAYLMKQVEYFHLITGSDYPVKPLSEFKTFFQIHKNENFMEHFPVPHRNWGKDGGLRRIRYYWFGLNKIDIRGAYSKLMRLNIRIQKKIKINRSFQFFNGKLWAGGTYWSLSRSAIGVFINYIDKNPNYIQRFKYTSIGEEIFVQTVLLNLNVPLINNYLRYINWDEDGANPVVLAEKDFDNIIKSDCFFARKFDKTKSAVLIDSINLVNSSL